MVAAGYDSQNPQPVEPRQTLNRYGKDENNHRKYEENDVDAKVKARPGD
jgi:hypothetical protein